MKKTSIMLEDKIIVINDDEIKQYENNETNLKKIELEKTIEKINEEINVRKKIIGNKSEKYGIDLIANITILLALILGNKLFISIPTITQLDTITNLLAIFTDVAVIGVATNQTKNILKEKSIKEIKKEINLLLFEKQIKEEEYNKSKDLEQLQKENTLSIKKVEPQKIPCIEHTCNDYVKPKVLKKTNQD